MSDSEIDSARVFAPKAKPKSILIANMKGGCGKTTLATTLASAFAAAGARTVLADADPQRSGLTWLARRPRAERPVGALDWTRKRDIGIWAPPLSPFATDWLIIDAPGAIKGRRVERLIEEADAVLVPVMPSLYDEMAAQRFLLQVENMRKIRRGRADVFAVANRIRPRARAAQDLSGFFARLEMEPAAELEERAAYSELAGQGLALFDRLSKELEPIKRQWAPLLRALGLDPAALAASRAPADRPPRANIA